MVLEDECFLLGARPIFRGKLLVSGRVSAKQFFFSEKQFQTVWNDWNIEDFLETKHPPRYLLMFYLLRYLFIEKHAKKLLDLRDSLAAMGFGALEVPDNWLSGPRKIDHQGPLVKPWDGKLWCWSWHVIWPARYIERWEWNHGLRCHSSLTFVIFKKQTKHNDYI